MNKILLIGNGPSALKDSTLGKKIDMFQTVGRFNDYKIKGFEEYVGSKCNVWVTCLGENIIIKSLQDDSQRVPYFASFNQSYDELRFKRIREKIPHIEKFPQWAWDETKEISNYNAPSSGAVAMVFFSKVYDETYVLGFDSFTASKHHYGDDAKLGRNHKSIPEKKLFDFLLKEKRIILFN